MKYTNETKLENFLMTDIDSSLSSQIEAWGDAVDLYIEKYTNRKDGFVSVAASIKYFDGNGLREIDIDEFTSLTTVQILESDGEDVEWTLTEGLENDYVAYPYNTITQYRLILTANATVGAWFTGTKRIKITAVWGYSATVPKDIELAATMLLASIVEKGIRGGKIQSESLGDYSVSYASLDNSVETLGIRRLLEPYKLRFL